MSGPHQEFIDIVRAIRSKRVRGCAYRLEVAFERAILEAHTRGRLYARGGEKTKPSEEWSAVQGATRRIFARIAPRRERVAP